MGYGCLVIDQVMTASLHVRGDTGPGTNNAACADANMAAYMRSGVDQSGKLAWPQSFNLPNHPVPHSRRTDGDMDGHARMVR